MAKEQQWTSQYYLAADEHMQLDISCVNLLKVQHAYSFLVRTTCVEVLNKSFGTKIPFQMVVTIDPKTQTIAIQLDIVDWATVNPARIKSIVELVQGSPQLTELLLRNIEERIAIAESEKVLELINLKQFYLSTLHNGISSFTVSKLAENLIYLFDIKTIEQSAKFSMSNKGGKLRFTFTVGFTQNALIQLYDVSCIMYMFVDNGKLGYYFEFYLDESNYHHQEIYAALPDQLMDNEHFLMLVAQIMENHVSKEYGTQLQQLIAIFKASM